MTKQEIYSTLADDGEKLPPISKITKQELEDRFRALYGTSPDGDDETPEQPETPEKPQEDAAPAQEDGEAANDAQNAPETPETEQQEEPEDQEPEPQQPETRVGKPPMLHFTAAGWCDALRRSYFVGWYEPHTWEEYDALRPFAEG